MPTRYPTVSDLTDEQVNQIIKADARLPKWQQEESKRLQDHFSSSPQQFGDLSCVHLYSCYTEDIHGSVKYCGGGSGGDGGEIDAAFEFVFFSSQLCAVQNCDSVERKQRVYR